MVAPQPLPAVPTTRVPGPLGACSGSTVHRPEKSGRCAAAFPPNAVNAKSKVTSLVFMSLTPSWYIGIWCGWRYMREALRTGSKVRDEGVHDPNDPGIEILHIRFFLGISPEVEETHERRHWGRA